MTESTETVVVEPAPTARRFDLRKVVKITLLALTGVGLLVIAKRKLSANVDGEVTATVGTNDES